MPKKILLLAHSFPPEALPESYLIVKRLGNLENCEVDVITVKAFLPWIKKDPDFFKFSERQFSSICILKPPAWYKYLPFSRLESLFSLPDAYMYLLYLYRKKIKEIDISKYDVVMTWSMFHSIHFLGSFLKKMNKNLLWISHFSDPWADNPFLNKRYLVRVINQKLEKYIFRKTMSLSKFIKSL